MNERLKTQKDSVMLEVVDVKFTQQRLEPWMGPNYIKCRA